MTAATAATAANGVTVNRAAANQIYQVLPEIARLVALYWESAHHRASQGPCARIGEDRLTITLDDALTPLEAQQASTEQGYRDLLAVVHQEIDGVYPQLATQVERHFHCYVGAMHVSVIPARAAIRVELGLREAPAYLAGTSFEASCR